MKPYQIILAIAAGWLLMSGYQEGKNPPTPDNKPVPNININVEPEVFPPVPSQTLQQSLSGLDSVFQGNEGAKDAYLLARAYKQWAVLVARTPGATNLGEFTNAYKNSLKTLLLNTQLAGKYGGRIDTILNEAYTKQLSYLVGPNGVESTEIDNKVRASLVEWLNACSWKFNEVFLKLNGKAQ